MSVDGGQVVKKIWRKAVGAQRQAPSERVLANCPRTFPQLHCESFGGGAVELAVFLQSSEKHPDGGATANAGRVKIAYRSYHPKPFWFKRQFTCTGGSIAGHDIEEEFEIPAGKTEGRAFRTALVPDGVHVEPGLNGAQVSATIRYAKGEPLIGLDPMPFSVSFPAEMPLKCLCC